MAKRISDFLLITVYKSTSVQKYEQLSGAFYGVMLGGVNKAEGKRSEKGA
ncbi:hypothetical protein [Photobacterium leiognathi]|nr:hypothetical protein [Photobacterium leiognathi]